MDESGTEVSEQVTYESLASLIDYHALRPEMTDDELVEACRVAREYRVSTIVVRPADVDQALRWIDGSGVRLGSTIGYPDGSTTTAVKLYEGRDLLRRGVRELEMVVNVGKLISRQFQFVETELMQMAKSCLEAGAILKISMRNSFLSNDLKIILLKVCKRVEAGFLSLDVNEADLALLQPIVRDRISLKAWQVGSLEDALAAQGAGYKRLGCTDPAAILDPWRAHLARLEAENAGAPVS